MQAIPRKVLIKEIQEKHTFHCKAEQEKKKMADLHDENKSRSIAGNRSLAELI